LSNTTTYNDTICRLSPGDRAGFVQAYELFYLPIFQFTKKLVDQQQQAEDITADSFVKLWRHLELGEPVNNVKAFLRVTARNACYDYLRASRVHHQKEREILYLAEQEEQLAFYSAEVKAEVLYYVHAEIEKLPPKCREIFKLSYLEGMKVGEVAEYLQLSEQTVSNQKTRALKMLKLALKDKQWMLLAWLLYHARW